MITDPEKTFIIYGSLAPGRPNHSKIEHIKGKWEKGIVRGRLVDEGWGAAMGYKGFIPVKENPDPIPVYILISDELNANWKMLDEFEGDEYRRILCEYESENGTTGVGYIYAISS